MATIATARSPPCSSRLRTDPNAITRSLWFATNTGYARALDGFLKVKTEQQVRAKEEDDSADFSAEPPQTGLQTGLLPPAPPLAVDRAAWEQRLREISSLFSQFPERLRRPGLLRGGQ